MMHMHGTWGLLWTRLCDSVVGCLLLIEQSRKWPGPASSLKPTTVIPFHQVVPDYTGNTCEPWIARHAVVFLDKLLDTGDFTHCQTVT